MKRAVYPGTFDPVTNGHLDIIKRASKLFDEVVVGVLRNSAKTPLFSTDERVNMLREVTKDIPNVRIQAFDGLSVDFVRACDVIAGLKFTYLSSTTVKEVATFGEDVSRFVPACVGEKLREKYAGKTRQ